MKDRSDSRDCLTLRHSPEVAALQLHQVIRGRNPAGQPNLAVSWFVRGWV